MSYDMNVSGADLIIVYMMVFGLNDVPMSTPFGRMAIEIRDARKDWRALFALSSKLRGGDLVRDYKAAAIRLEQALED